MSINTIIIDMYGVIIKERIGNFLPYVYNKFSETEHARINKLIYEDRLFTKAGYGEISSNDFLAALGFDDPEYAMKEYIEKYLTIDNDFFAFAEKYHKEYDFVLLSTDVSEWSKYITEYYELDKYFKHKIVSGDVHLRKPNKAIYELTLERICKNPDECLFIDDSVANIQQAAELGIKTILFTGFDDAYNFIVSSTNS